MSKKTRSRSPRHRRTTLRSANHRLPMPSFPDIPLRLSEIADFRSLRSVLPPTPFTTTRKVARLVPTTRTVSHKKARAAKTPFSAVAFEQPHNTLVCIRRSRRKEILHALKKTGRKGQKRPRRSAFSDIHC